MEATRRPEIPSPGTSFPVQYCPVPQEIKLPRPGTGTRAEPGAATTAAAPGALSLGTLGSLLHFALGHPGLDWDGLGLTVFLTVGDGGPLPRALYRYQPSRHRLIRSGAPPATSDSSPVAPLTLSLGCVPSAPPQAAGTAAALLHRLALAAAELDLAPRPAEPDPEEGAERLVAGPLALGTAPDDPSQLARRLLSGARGRGGADPDRRLEAILAVALRRCPTPLIDDAAGAALERLARATRLPSRDVGLECRLAADDPRVDLAAALETRLTGVPRARDVTRSGIPTTGDWSALDRFRRAHTASELLCRSTRHLGLELDADAGLPPLAAPGLFVGLEDGTLGPRVRGAVAAGLPALMGKTGYRSSAAGLAAFLDALPEGSVLHYFGAFPGRAPAVARCNVQYPDRAAALAQLARQGFSERHLAAAGEAHDQGARVVFAYDVGPSLHRRLGIELLFDDPSHLEPVLDALVRRGLCAPAKRDAVLAWPGALQESEAEEPWPPPLAAAGRSSPGLRSVLFFKLSHLKLVVDDEGLAAKAYLQLQHCWVPALQAPQRTA